MQKNRLENQLILNSDGTYVGYSEESVGCNKKRADYKKGNVDWRFSFSVRRTQGYGVPTSNDN